MVISIDEFEKVDIRVGKIIDAKDFPGAKKPAYQLTIDLGDEIGIKHSSAQITTLYTTDELVGKLILAVVNFPPRQIANFFSEVLVLGLKQTDGSVVLLEPEREVALGVKVS
jgi:tRNA-binding protein